MVVLNYFFDIGYQLGLTARWQPWFSCGCVIFIQLLAKSRFIFVLISPFTSMSSHPCSVSLWEKGGYYTLSIPSVLRINETSQPPHHKQRDCILVFMLDVSSWQYNVSLVITLVYICWLSEGFPFDVLSRFQ